MDPWKQRAEEPTESVDLLATGGPVSFAGLSIHASVSSNLVHHCAGTGSPEYSQVVHSLDAMSISEASCLRVSGSSTNTVTGDHPLDKDTKVVTELSLYAQINDAVPVSGCGGNRRYDQSNKASVQVFHIPPRMIFFGALRSIGIVNPAIIDVGFKGAHQVHIQFVCNLPLCLESGSKFVDITGDVCVSYELAETSAIKKAFDHLYKWHNVVVVDISYRKKQDHIHNGRIMYCNVMDGLRVVGHMIQHWLECFDKLYQVEKYALLPRLDGSHVDSRIATDVLAFLASITDNAIPKIRSFDTRLKRLAASKDEWTERSNSLPWTHRKGSIIKAYHYEEDVLALILRWLRLPECQFCAAPVDGGRFLGAVMLSYPDTQNVVPVGDTCVEADREESTVEEAKNRAARMAIYRLEGEFNVDIVGLNHSEAVLAGHESAMICGLNIEVKLLGASICKEWEEMVNNLNEAAKKNAAALMPPVYGSDGAASFATQLVSQFELAAADCYELFKVDAAQFNLLN